MTVMQSLIVITTLTIAGLTGCATVVDEAVDNKTKTETMQPKQVKVDSSTNERKQLVDLLIESYAIENLIEVAVNVNDDSMSNELSQCLYSDNAINNASEALKIETNGYINRLSDEEVTQYLTYMQSNIDTLKRYYILKYDLNRHKIEGSHNISHILNHLNDIEKDILSTIFKLPNITVRTSLLPIIEIKTFENYRINDLGNIIVSSIKQACN